MKVSELQAPEIRDHAGGVIRRELEQHGDATFNQLTWTAAGGELWSK